MSGSVNVMGKHMRKKDELAEPAARAKPRLKPRTRPAGSDRFRNEQQEIAVFDPEHVERVLDALPDAATLSLAADRLQGLAHPSRLQALIALSIAELCVGDIAAVLGLSLSATSTMLKQLRSLGYVTMRHAGKQTYYRVASTLPRAILDAVLVREEPPTQPA